MADRSEILSKLAEYLEADTDIRIDALNEATSFRESLGIDSVDLVGLIMRIEEHYRIRLSHAELEQVATVGSLLDLIESKITANAASSRAA